MWSPSRSILSSLLTLLGPVILFAQANSTAQLTGTVTDSSGGVVSGAKVIVTDDATNIAATAVIDAGIVPHHNVKPTPETSARITIAANANATLSFLPFLGAEQILTGERSGDKLIFHLPPFDRGAVVWLNDSK
ncbi:MAG TPA: carboxypeptidase-like regulatory domain-containing protein [Candidatus Sulfotelmatobacter sp.]|jgi:hypothetical protein|nr:carboxypeptidase-like regulatory domain-containing protein [Candidatus Sulfotelmatobacter sp.]